ncbi:dihydropteroate synthase [Neorhizobium sp. NCHU2750]|uniref:dihydropteroate synthase n=1 Tax=Neorhizobium sp. NCHU2750 TaxID=1825976 RepID=UPI000EB657DA|nr:dihydropteroate synthase [Neorhizobium sp. NCHU2750]
MTSPRNSEWRLAHGRSLSLEPGGHIMAIVNVTPDSFSDGGRFVDVAQAVAHGQDCLAQGATILDIGGESTRPGAEPVSAAQEQDRILPVIEALAKEGDALISVDTYRADTARLAIAAGAHIVNDVYGLRYDAAMADVVSESGAGLCIMYTARDRDDHRADIIEDEIMFFGRSLDMARTAGVSDEAIVLDPGFGFVRDRQQDAELMVRCGELERLGFPLLVGTSRKRFLGAITGREVPAERDSATAATTAMLRLAGASIFRVHNVAANLDALRMANAVLEAARATETTRES